MLLTGLPAPGSGQVQPVGAASVSAVRGGDAEFDPIRHLRALEQRLADRPEDVRLQVERLGTLYLLAVEVEEAIEVGVEVLDSIETRFGATHAWLPARLHAYEGAFTMLRAKHGFWPHHRMRHVTRGNQLLDRAVSQAPDDAVIRYLRLMSGFYLPGLFGRQDEVRADLARLAELLPTARSDFPGRLHETVVRFVLENGHLDAVRRVALERILGGQ